MKLSDIKIGSVVLLELGLLHEIIEITSFEYTGKDDPNLVVEWLDFECKILYSNLNKNENDSPLTNCMGFKEILSNEEEIQNSVEVCKLFKIS